MTFKELIDQLILQCGYGAEDYEFASPSKLKFYTTPKPGDRVRIVWRHEAVDHGYLLTLPGFEPDDFMVGGVVHVHTPYDDVAPIWITLDQLLANELVETIELTR